MAVPSTPVARRVVTAPEVRPSQQQTLAQTGDGLVETLFSHPAVKIVAFNAGARTFSLNLGRGAVVPELEPGSLDAFSQLERTIAVGKEIIVPRSADRLLTRTAQVHSEYTVRLAQSRS
jgi:hypothetical protein